MVFPRLLESRGVNGEKVLVINDKLKLELSPSTVFSDDVTVYTTENGHPVQYYVSKTRLRYVTKSQRVSARNLNSQSKFSGSLGKVQNL